MSEQKKSELRDVAEDVKFDPDGEIRSQEDAKRYSEELIRERKERHNGKPVR